MPPPPEIEPIVTAWRYRVLRRLGLPEQPARQAAAHRAIDVREVTVLVGRGCPPRTALRILAPIEWTGEEDILSCV